MTFSCDASAPGQARQLIARVLADGEAIDLLTDAQLIASELVTNAVIHTGCDDLRLEIDLVPDGHLRIAVVDADPDHPPASRPDVEVGGLGLRIVEAVADHWGVHVGDDSKTVWADLRTA